MNQGRTVFSQLISFLPDREFRRCVELYQGDLRLRGFTCWDQVSGNGLRPVDLSREALQAYLEKIIAKELAAWAKKFPDEFYENIYKLKGWP